MMNTGPEVAGVPEDIQRLVDEHRAQYARAAEQGAAAERVQQRWAETGGASATSLRGEVTVRVGPAGLLEDVRIQQRGLDLGAAGLSRLLTATLRQALVNLEESAAEDVAEADGGAVGGAMLAEIRTGLAGPLTALRGDESDLREG
ncbi:YbaB/EbfC family nucleoid-associated protein [Microbacterium sp. NPDC089189]|uniref:YbaB/EbfC family nucleoid-associated protein n=1 Tax=Microbacterium sp. NPDC089189 TaxID=3154972 RepID=UPI00342C79BD